MDFGQLIKKKQNVKYAKEAYTMSSEIGEYRNMLEEIDVNLANLDEKNHLVKSIMTSDTNDEEVDEDILLHIEHMNELLGNSKHKVVYMEKNLKKLRKVDNVDEEQIHKLEMEVCDMARTIVDRDMEIGVLQQMVIGEGIDIAILAEAYNEQAMYNDILLEIINTAFFVAGTKKELKDHGILDMEGGFVGIGRVKTLNENASLEFMDAIDINKTDIIELAGKKIKLITPHPIDSYTITYDKDKDITMLGISNKLHFWQETNYLAIEIK
jgi:hypothetical protein